MLAFREDRTRSMTKYFPRIIGHSVEGRAIEAWIGPEAVGGTLLIGGFHGDEFATISLLREFRPAAIGVVVLPVLNPDGAERGMRYNARGLDLNRNFDFNWRADSVEPSGPQPWSEPESRALRDFISAVRPAKIVALHWALAEIDADGVQSTALAEAMWAALDEAERAPYRLRVTEVGRGQRRLERIYAECPGSLGQWAGYGLVYPDGSQPAVITLELPAEPELARAELLPEDHLESLRARWARDSHGYLSVVEPGVRKMLLAACAHGG